MTGITQRELLLEMREDIRGRKAAVDAIACDQALGVERRAAMQRSADSIYARLDGHDRDRFNPVSGSTQAVGQDLAAPLVVAALSARPVGHRRDRAWSLRGTRPRPRSTGLWRARQVLGELVQPSRS